MRIRGDYLRNLPVLLDRWIDDIDRLDVRIQPDNAMDAWLAKGQASQTKRYERPKSGHIADSP
jgi:hypothetical protein